MKVLGVMSGTSHDGIDIALCEFIENGENIQWEILNSSTYTYSSEWKNALLGAPEISGERLMLLHCKYGTLIGEFVNRFISEFQISTESIDLVSSHGHTIFHQPDEKMTLQIGHGAYIAERCKITTVCDFRTSDLAKGGQGAPLVPIGDELLFRHFDYCINIGGIANISQDYKGQRIAYDICPANMVLNELSQKLGKLYDDGGRFASQGTINEPLLERLNSLDYYSLPHPKSLGKEWVVSNVFKLLNTQNISVEDMLATFVEHIAIQIRNSIKKPLMSTRILVTGGGAWNKYLIGRINNLLGIDVIMPSAQLVEFKEALIFAFLGYLRVNGKNNILSSVTGAKEDHSAGTIFKAS